MYGLVFIGRGIRPTFVVVVSCVYVILDSIAVAKN